MKKTLKKAILTCAAVTAMLVAMSATAMAASYADGKVTTEIDLSGVEAGKQVTILVVPKGEDVNPVASAILYINQEAKDESTFVQVPVDPAKIEDGKTYVVKIGGEGISEIKTSEFTLGGEVDYKLGDVNDDGKIKVNDASMVVDYVLGADLTEKQLLAADTNKDGKVKVNDASDIVDYVLGLPNHIEGTKN